MLAESALVANNEFKFGEEHMAVLDQVKQATVRAAASGAALMGYIREHPAEALDVMPVIEGRINPKYEYAGTFPEVDSFMKDTLSEGRVLDVGCGGIELRDIVPPERITYTDIQPFDLLSNVRPDERDEYAARFHQVDVKDLVQVFGVESFDNVFASGFVGKENAEEVLPQILAVVKPGGTILLRTMEHDETLKEVLNAAVVASADLSGLEMTYSQDTYANSEIGLEYVTNPQLLVKFYKQ